MSHAGIRWDIVSGERRRQGYGLPSPDHCDPTTTPGSIHRQKHPLRWSTGNSSTSTTDEQRHPPSLLRHPSTPVVRPTSHVGREPTRGRSPPDDRNPSPVCHKPLRSGAPHRATREACIERGTGTDGPPLTAERAVAGRQRAHHQASANTMAGRSAPR